VTYKKAGKASALGGERVFPAAVKGEKGGKKGKTRPVSKRLLRQKKGEDAQKKIVGVASVYGTARRGMVQELTLRVKNIEEED